MIFKRKTKSYYSDIVFVSLKPIFSGLVWDDPIKHKVVDESTERERNLCYASIFPPILEKYFPNTTHQLDDRLGIETFYYEVFKVGITHEWLERDEYDTFQDEMYKREGPIKEHIKLLHEKTKHDREVKVAVFHNEQPLRSRVKERTIHFGEAVTECSKLKFKEITKKDEELGWSRKINLKREADQRLIPYTESIIRKMEYIDKTYKYEPDPKAEEYFRGQIKGMAIPQDY